MMELVQGNGIRGTREAIMAHIGQNIGIRVGKVLGARKEIASWVRSRMWPLIVVYL